MRKLVAANRLRVVDKKMKDWTNECEAGRKEKRIAETCLGLRVARIFSAGAEEREIVGNKVRQL